MGNNAAVTVCRDAGPPELNVFKPVIIYNAAAVRAKLLADAAVSSPTIASSASSRTGRASAATSRNR
jgi:fumarate hydratase class II